MEGNVKKRTQKENSGDQRTQSSSENGPPCYEQLPCAEWALYICFMISTAAYCLFRVFKESQNVDNFAYYPYPLEPGLFGDERHFLDTSNTDWVLMEYFLKRLVPWCIAHCVLSQIIRKYMRKKLPLFNVVISFAFNVHVFGLHGALVYVLQPAVFYLVHLANRVSLVWISAIYILVHAHNYVLPKTDDYVILSLQHIGFAWETLRCVGYCVDTIKGEIQGEDDDDEEPKSHLKNLVDMLAFCTYLPSQIPGPLILYKEHFAGMLRPYTPLSWRLIWEWSFELLRMMAWWMATYVSLHFMYHRAISLQSGVVRFDLATMLGLCFALFGSFFVQYYVFYGIPILFANIDQIKSPTRPKCVFAIAKSSELWRTFDGGLYDFMKKYIYIQSQKPLLRSTFLGKVFGSLLTFTFVFVWHGTTYSIFYWTCFNFVLVLAEMLAKEMWKQPAYRSFESKFFTSGTALRRFHAALTAPLTCSNFISHLYFLADARCANHFIWRIWGAEWLSLAALMFYCYCQSQIALEYKIGSKLKLG